METSLTGKALNFGFNEYGFESHVSNISTLFTNNIVNLINLNSNKNNLWFTIYFTKSFFNFIIFLKSIKLIENFLLFKKNNKIYITVKLFYIKKKKIILTYKNFSKSSRIFFISLKALKFLKFKTGTSVYVISTSDGLLTLSNCLKKQKSGFLLGSFFN